MLYAFRLNKIGKEENRNPRENIHMGNNITTKKSDQAPQTLRRKAAFWGLASFNIAVVASLVLCIVCAYITEDNPPCACGEMDIEMDLSFRFTMILFSLLLLSFPIVSFIFTIRGILNRKTAIGREYALLGTAFIAPVAAFFMLALIAELAEAF